MTDVGEKIKEMVLDKSNFECFMESDFPIFVATRIVGVEILPAEKGSVNLFLTQK